MFDILGAGDGTQLGVASENDVLEARKEAIPNSIEPEYPFRSQKIHELTQQTFVRYRVDQAAVVAGKPNEPRPNYRSLQRGCSRRSSNAA